MATADRSATIRVDQGAVWGMLSDFGAIARWTSFVEHSSLVRSGPMEPGLTRRIQMGRMVVLERLVDVDVPHALEYEIEGLPERISSVRNRWVIEDEGPDSSTVSVTTTVTIGPRPPQRLAELVLARILARRSGAMLAGLTNHLESTGG